MWDELDRLAVTPSLLAPASSGNSPVRIFNRDHRGFTYCVIIAVGRNDATRTLTLLGITVETVAHPPMG